MRLPRLKRQFWDTLSQFSPALAHRLLDEWSDPREDPCGHQHVPDAGDVLTVILAQQGEYPRDQFWEALLGTETGHRADCLDLILRGDTFPYQAIEVRVLLVQVEVEVELEGGGGPCRLQRVVRRNRFAQGVVGGVQASVVTEVRLRHRRRHLFQRRER